ncbi:MAG TPA: dephospho-CoA kinase [Candidatus Pullichristensenella excrementigallinarum]|uniref:Dephospho-CoA kinase n=1 Tax=Candidatus Pullichristensenella excrementigallinarum TaxID=2840907 RepID=A0A9D1IDC1_9FIRM|nr:dephospho-CoA kinase [Candidatus Pullichristensenella excrementigallinarum]
MLANKPYIVGVTGGIGSGKSEAAKYLATLGAMHVDADAISHELTSTDPETLREIQETFGEEVFTPEGCLDRKAMGEKTFSNEKDRRALEKILHPRIQRRMIQQIDEAAKQGVKIVVLDVPLLFETGMDALCDETWVLAANLETQLARVMMRDHIEREDAMARVQSQMPAEEKQKRATYTISTERSIEKTQAELNSLYQQALKRAGG